MTVKTRNAKTRAVREAAAPEEKLTSVGTDQRKIDGLKLAAGKGAFVDDFSIRGMLHGKLLYSPHPHARIIKINTEKARALPGVQAVLTYQDVPRIPYTTAGQGYPEPSPYDNFIFDSKVRYVGDRVAAVAAETPEIAEEAVSLIEVEYEQLPPLLDPRRSMDRGAPVIHDEPDCKGVLDPGRNLVAHVRAVVGDVERGFQEADFVLEREYIVNYVQQCPIEPHVCITYIDDDGRVVIRTTTQVPFHCRRIVAQALGLPLKNVRVIKPRVGGGFGGKQEILNEEVCAALTLATRRPVRLKLTRSEEFVSTRTRHPQILTVKSGAKRDGTLTAMKLTTLGNTGAYGTHALTVHCVTGATCLALYRSPHIFYEAHVVYTNLPVAGAYRGYGAPQGFFAIESQMDEMAIAIGMDPLTFREKNAVREGDSLVIREVLGEGKEGFKQTILSCSLKECMSRGAARIGWERRQKLPSESDTPQAGSQRPFLKRGFGMACLIQASGIPGIDMGAASIKMNEDGSFNLLVGAADIGTGADTVFAQIAAEVLGVSAEDILVYSSDTDLTPFDVGAYASSTSYISGNAVKKAAEEAKKQILKVAAALLEADPSTLHLSKGKAATPSGKSVTLSEVALHAFYARDQFQIIGTASHTSLQSPPPFAAQFAEVEVDTETGVVRVVKFVSAVDCGKAINPRLAEGQVEGAVAQALGYALTEQMIFDGNGRMVNPDLSHYRIFSSKDMPEMETLLVESHEPTGPFGAKSVAEIGINGAAPVIANAIRNAIGIRIREIPFTPERVLEAIRLSQPLE